MRETCEITARIAASTRERLLACGFDVPVSFTNFLLIRPADEATAINADSALRSRGLILRRQSGVGLGHCLRMTIGGEDDMAFAISALEDWQQEKGG